MTSPRPIADVALEVGRQLSQAHPQASAELSAVAGESVPLYTSLGRLVVALNKHSDLRLLALFGLWLGMQNLHRRGASQPGWLELNESGAARLALCCGLSSHTLRVLLAEGQGLFWEGSGRLFFRSPQRLAGWLMAWAADRGIGDPFERSERCAMPVSLLSLDKAELTAYIFDAWLSVRTGSQGHFARWEDLESLWCYSRQHIRRWLKNNAAIIEEKKGLVYVDQR